MNLTPNSEHIAHSYRTFDFKSTIDGAPYAVPRDGSEMFFMRNGSQGFRAAFTQSWKEAGGATPTTQELDALTAFAQKSAPPFSPPPPPPLPAQGTRPPSMSTQMVAAMQAEHDIFPGDDGAIYAVPHDGDGRGLAVRVTSRSVIRSCQGLGMGGVVKGAADAAEILKAHAELEPPRPLALRAARPDPGTVVLDLAQPGSARCVQITGSGWLILEQPPEGVVFRRSGATRPLPTPTRGGSLSVLADLLVLKTSDPRWLLIRGWLAAALLSDIPRPIVVFLGAAGSAKTSRAAFVVGILDPKKRGSLGGGFGKNVTDDETKALAHHLVAYDNLDKVSAEISDHLARLVTGNTGERRTLFTDADLTSVAYRRTGVITAVTLPPGIKPDALERLITVHCDRIDDSARLAESGLWEQWEAAHPAMLGAVLDDVVKVLSKLPAVQGRKEPLPRMADYWQALKALGLPYSGAYRDMVENAMVEAAESDLFVATVRDWLESRQERGFKGTAAEALEACTKFHQRRTGDVDGDGLPTFIHQHQHRPGTEGAWMPTQPNAFSTALTRAEQPMAAVGVSFETKRSNGHRSLVLRLDPQ